VCEGVGASAGFDAGSFLHLPIGKFAVRPGRMMAGGAFFAITGKGFHGARPKLSNHSQSDAGPTTMFSSAISHLG
jgi:hypothetical protein